jgi:hypothetical protein
VGGFATDFRPVMLSDRVFKFMVSSKEVAFHIFNLKSFSCDNYKIFFSLWRNGGAHWNSEYKKYLLEEEQEWTTVLSKKAKALQASRANNVKASHSLLGANMIPLGQHFHKSDKSSFVHHQAGVNSPSFSNRTGLYQGNSGRRSVFERVKWPQSSCFNHRYPPHQKKNQGYHTDRRNNHQYQQWRRKNLGSKLQISNEVSQLDDQRRISGDSSLRSLNGKDKGKQPTQLDRPESSKAAQLRTSSSAFFILGLLCKLQR